MKVSELINQLKKFQATDFNMEVFAKGEIFSIKEVNLHNRDNVIELACGWTTVEDEREEEYISEMNKRGW